MKWAQRNGAWIAAVAAVAIAAAGWLRKDGGYEQKVDGLVTSVAELQTQLNQVQQELARYLYRNDGGRGGQPE